MIELPKPIGGFGRCGLGGAAPPKVGEATPPIHAPIIITFMAPVVELIILLWLISLVLSIEWGFPTSDLPRPLTVEASLHWILRYSNYLVDATLPCVFHYRYSVTAMAAIEAVPYPVIDA